MADSLKKLVLDGRLKTPVQRGFVADAWDSALSGIRSPSEEDLRIYQLAKFIGEQTEALRRRLKAASPPSGTVVDMIRRAIGFVNREFLTALDRVSSQDITGPISINDLLQEEFELAGGINTATQQELMESVVDGLRFEIATLVSGKVETLEVPGDLAVGRIGLRGNLSVFYHMLEEQWLDGLHHGWGIRTTTSGYSVLFPFDRESAIDFAVGQYRDNALAAEIAERTLHSLETTPSLLRRSRYSGIIRVRAGKKKTYKSTRMSDELSTEILIARIMSAEPDLEPFATAPLPNLGNMTALELLNVWTALIQLAQDTGTRMPFNEDISHLNQVERFAPMEHGPSLIAALEKSTGLPKQKCASAIEQFKWRNVRDSLWHRPLVKVGEQGNFIMILSVLRTVNLRRSIEYWLGEGGLDLAERGGPYENHVRRHLSDAIQANKMLYNHAGVIQTEVRPSDASIGDIDLLFWIGTTICVGETKCLLRPGTAHERFQYDERIREAAGQVRRKAAHIKDNLDWLLRAYNVPIDPKASVNIVPCVILNSSVGALRIVQEIPIVDTYIIGRYLSKGYGIMNATTNKESSGIRISFYGDAAQAASNLAEYLKNPPHLRVYRESVDWDIRQQPDLVRENSTVLRLFPTVRVQIPQSAVGDRAEKS